MNERRPTCGKCGGVMTPADFGTGPEGWRAEAERLRAEALRHYDPDGTVKVFGSPEEAVAARKECAWRVGELEAENARLKAGLGMVAQIVHGSTRTTHRIAEAVLGGADPRDPRFVEVFG